MPRFVRLLLLLLLSVFCLVPGTLGALPAQAAGARIDVLTIKGTINPVLVDYLARSIEQAEDAGAAAVIIELDTPGGLDTAMRDIIQEILNARVPVVVYVSPSGARAASAGLYVTIAAHVAAMAPNTATGAATPVALGAEGEAAMSEEMKAKTLNDAIAYIRSLADSHGRNADWAEMAVREGVSITEREALEMNVIDLVAPDLESLLAQLDGRQVTLLSGQVVTLDTGDAVIHRVPMRTIESFLYAIADPNIAYLLLSIATLGIMAEIFNPGLIFPGVVGGICGILAFYSLGQLPVNIAGVLLIVLAFAFFVAEAFTATFGVLAGGGIISLIIGSLILFKGASPLFRVDPWLIAAVSLTMAAFLVFVVQRVVKAHRRQSATGREELIGKKAQVRTALAPRGSVFYKGELWSAIAEEGHHAPGEEVMITRLDGLTLYVTGSRQGKKDETTEK